MTKEVVPNRQEIMRDGEGSKILKILRMINLQGLVTNKSHQT